MDLEEFNLIESKHSILIKKAIDIMIKVTDDKHSLSHVESVVKYTKEILKYEANANKEVCIIAAYWHDVGRSIQDKGHALISADMLKNEMENLNYNKDFINACYLAIYKHSINDVPETLEGIIVKDADKIDFIGINRWKQCIENNCKFTKILELLPKLRNDILRLDCSKKIYDVEIANLIKYLHDVIFNKTI